MVDLKSLLPGAKVRGVCLVRRKSDGLIRTDMPDGSVRYLTDEEWEIVLAERLRQAADAEPTPPPPNV